MAVTMEAIELEISGSSGQASAGISALTSSLSSLKSEVSGAVGVLKELKAALSGIGKAKIPNVGSAIESAMGDTAKVSDTVAESFENVTDNVKETAKNFGESAPQIEKVKKAVKETGGAAKTATKHTSGFMSSVGRILKYRAIRTVLSSITKGLKTGMNNLYQYSKAVGTDFAKSMDSASSSMLTLKNGLATAIAPAIAPLVGILNAVTSAALTAFNALAQFFALLGGKSSWTKATAAATDFGKAVGGGGGGAMKELLADFDELNVIASQGGGGGGGAGGIDYESMFTEVTEFDSFLEKHFNLIKDTVISIGAGILAWKIASKFSNDLSTVAGIALTISGLVETVLSTLTAWNKGVTFDTLNGQLLGTGLMVAGLGLKFGVTGAAIGLVVGSVSELVVGLKEWITTGKATNETITTLVIGIAGLGIAIATLTGSWIPLAVAAVADLAVVIAGHWEDIKAWAKQAWEDTKTFVTKTIPDGFKSAWNSFSSWLNENIVKNVEETWEKVKETASSAWESVKTFFTSTIPQTLSSALESVKNAVVEAAETAVNFVVDKVNWLIQQINSVLGIVGIEIPLIPNVDFGVLDKEKEKTETQVKNWNLEIPQINDTVVLQSIDAFDKSLNDTIKSEKQAVKGWKLVPPAIDASNITKSIPVITSKTETAYETWKKNMQVPILAPMVDKNTDEFIKAGVEVASALVSSAQEYINSAHVSVTGEIILNKKIIEDVTRTYHANTAGAIMTKSPNQVTLTNQGSGSSLKMFASGGMPTSGELYLARENGASEYIGSFGNQSVVANNQQIVDGIAQGVERAMRGVEERLTRIEQYSGITARKDTTVKISPSAALGRVVTQSQQQYAAVAGV